MFVLKSVELDPPLIQFADSLYFKLFGDFNK